jgi:predicted ATP-grasp superfamily ATP-dependent carboligase
LLHKYELALEEVACKGTKPTEAQTMAGPTAATLTVGFGIMVTEMALLVPVQPFTSVTVRLYTPEAVAVILAVVALLLQR